MANCFRGADGYVGSFTAQNLRRVHLLSVSDCSFCYASCAGSALCRARATRRSGSCPCYYDFDSLSRFECVTPRPASRMKRQSFPQVVSLHSTREPKEAHFAASTSCLSLNNRLTGNSWSHLKFRRQPDWHARTVST